MALQTRLFVEKGPSNSELQRYVSPTTSAIERYRSPVCLVQYEDSEAGILETLDEYMDSRGYDALSGSLAVDVMQRPANPAGVAGRVLVYARLEAGVLQLFARIPDGTTTQLTPTQPPAGYINGCQLSYTSASQVTIGTGAARDRLDKLTLVVAAPLVVDITVAGVGGLDVGVEAVSDWYYVYIIGDTTGVLAPASIMSLSQNVPAFPVGYDVARRVGSVRNQGGNFRSFQQFGPGMSRVVEYRDAVSSRQRLTGGAATVVTAVNCGPSMPPTSQMGHFQMQQRGTVAASIYDDPTQALADAQRTVFANGGALYDRMRTSAAREIAYANAAAGGLLDVFVTGYEETI